MACEKQFAQLQEPGGDPAQQSLILDMIRKLKCAMQDIWKVSSVDVFTVGYELFRITASCLIFCRSESDTNRADELAERLGSLSSLNAAFDPILSVILGSLDAAAVFMRTKALRSLGQILTSDPLVLRKASTCRVRIIIPTDRISSQMFGQQSKNICSIVLPLFETQQSNLSASMSSNYPKWRVTTTRRSQIVY
jgi:hypothetical protein